VVAIFIGVGGACGAVLRHLVAMQCRQMWGDRFPWGTLFINISGAFVIGLLTGLLLPASPWRLPLTAGFLGGYTTFSTWMLEVARLRQAQRWGSLLAYVFVSGLGGPMLTLIGLQIGGGIS